MNLDTGIITGTGIPDHQYIIPQWSQPNIALPSFGYLVLSPFLSQRESCSIKFTDIHVGDVFEIRFVTLLPSHHESSRGTHTKSRVLAKGLACVHPEFVTLCLTVAIH